MSYPFVSTPSASPPQPRWDDVRYIGEVAGRYALSDRKPLNSKDIPVYACRLRSISTRTAVVVAPVIGEVGETVAAHFDVFGIFRAVVTRKISDGFAMDLNLSDADRQKLAAKIAWRKRTSITNAADKREHKRILPRNPRTVLTLDNGEQLPCFVIDISQSGAAISAKVRPKLGVPVILGQLIGEVVRYLDVGFAIHFLELQDLAAVEKLMVPFQPE